MMLRVVISMALLLAAFAPLSALAQEGSTGDDHEVTTQSGGQTRDLVPGVIWTAAAVVAAGLVTAVFYFFKRRIGGFPEHPEWVAPISIMRSQDFPDETTFGEAAGTHGGAHGHH